jgi:hypothetical protein
MGQDKQLSDSLSTEFLLHEKLQGTVRALEEVGHLLRIVEANLKYSNERNEALKQENSKLKLACDEWMKRAINLEFKVLSARRDAE